MTLLTRIFIRYFMLVVAIGSMAAILIHERKRIKKIEAESIEIRQVRRDINNAHRHITRLALLGEGVIGWNKADFRHLPCPPPAHRQPAASLEIPLHGVCAPGTDRHPAHPLGGKRSTLAAHHGSDEAAGRRGQPAGESAVRSGKAGDSYLIKSPCKLFTACRG